MNRQNDAGAAVSVEVERHGSVLVESAPGHSKTRKVGDAYRHYCDQIDAGELLDPDDYCAQFPSFQSSLGKLLKAHCYLEAHPELLADEEEAPWPVAGQAYLDFQLVHELGQGAFARVFLAKQTALGDRLVVVKIARQGGAAEAKTLGRIQHPNVVPIHSIHADPETARTVVCMPYLGTATLHDVFDLLKATTARQASAQVFLDASKELDPQLLPPSERVPSGRRVERGRYTDALRRVALKMAKALAYIHEQGVCHLDLKPSNVLVSPDGEPLLLDFNLSSDAHRDRLVQGGTVPYMSPEQLCYFLGKGEKSAVGPGSDLFSFGVLLYELATGVHPFGPIPLKEPNDSLANLVLERQERGFEPVRQLNPEIDADLASLIESLLRYQRSNRPRAAADVALVLNRQSGSVAQTRRWITRNPIKLIAAVLLTLTLGAAAATPLALRAPESEQHFALAMRNYRNGEFVEAIQRFSIVIEKEKTNAAAFFGRARAYQKLGPADSTKYSLAIEDYEHAQSLAPNPRNLAAAGYCFQSMPGSKISAALVKYEAAEKAGFVSAELLNNMGLCYEKTGVNKAEARAYLDRAVALQPPCQAAFHNRGVILTYLARNNGGSLGLFAKNPGLKAAPMAKKLQAEFDEAIRLGRGDFDTALKMGPLSAELLLHAACFHVAASSVDPESKKTACNLLRIAIEQHNYVLNPTEKIFATLQGEKEYKALLNLPLPTGPATRAIRFVDPVRDLDD